MYFNIEIEFQSDCRKTGNQIESIESTYFESLGKNFDLEKFASFYWSQAFIGHNELE